MEVTQTQAQGLKREFNVVLPAADLAQRVDEQLSELKAKARIPGFRPGKVPVSYLKRLYGRSIIAEAVQEAVNEANRKIVEDHELRLALEPKIVVPDENKDLEKLFEAQSDFVFTVALEVLPKIEVHGLGDIEIERLTVEVSPNDIDTVLARLAENNRSYTPKGDDAAAEAGDRVNLNFTGTVDGEPFEGGSGQDVDLVLGSGKFPPGFESQIEGMKTGEQRTIALAFAESYGQPKLAGKQASFEVTLNAIAAPGGIAIDDSLAQGLGFEDLPKLKEGIRASIERDYSAASRARWKRILLDALDEKFRFEVPESMVSQEFDGIWRQVEAERSHASQGSEHEHVHDHGHDHEHQHDNDHAHAHERHHDHDHATDEAERADYYKIAERRVRLGLLLAEIGENAKVTVTDEEVTQAIARRAQAFPGEARAMWDYYRKNPRALAEIRAPLFEEKVIDYIITQIKVTDRTVAKDELMNAALSGGESEAEDGPAVGAQE
jgi:trigger factor